MSIKLKAIDLFCGAGGSSHGAYNAGLEIVAGFDIWQSALTIYQANFPVSKTFKNDLRTLSLRDIRAIKSSLGKVDVIMASPECTNHSRAKGAAERSEESRKTALEVLRFAKIFRSRWIIMENVVEMRAWDGYPTLIKELENLNYHVQEFILNSKNFGVPQSRERLFVLASLSDEIKPFVFLEQSFRPASSILDRNGKYSFSLLKKEGRAEKTIYSAERAISALGSETPFLLVYYGSGRRGSGGWQSIDEPLRTVTTVDRFAYVIPGTQGHLMRMLQPEELKLAMGFKPEFELSSINGLTKKDQVKAMGNSVCPPVMETLIRELVFQNFKRRPQRNSLKVHQSRLDQYPQIQ